MVLGVGGAIGEGLRERVEALLGDMTNAPTGEPDLDTLKALAAYRREVETTEPLPFGVYAAVAQPGRVRVGDPVELI